MGISNKTSRPVIGLEGPTCSGKSSIAEQLGRRFGLPVFNTGMMFRAAAIATLHDDITRDELPLYLPEIDVQIDGHQLAVNGQEATASAHLSRVALRAVAMNQLGVAGSLESVFDNILPSSGEYIAEGKRTPGNTVHRFYVTAGLEARALRRMLRARSIGEVCSFGEAMAMVENTDRLDSQSAQKLGVWSGGSIIDTTSLTVEQAVNLIDQTISG